MRGYLAGLYEKRVSSISRHDAVVTLFILAHVPLGLLFKQAPEFSIAHAVVVLCVGIVAALRKRPDQAIKVAAYIVGAEALWRATGGTIIWEYGKAGISLICLLCIVMSGNLKLSFGPIAYFLLLVPGTLMSMQTESAEDFRNSITFLRSGPFALAICAWYFSRVSLDRDELLGIMCCMAAPIMGTAGIVGGAVLGGQHIHFGKSSVMESSGGWGPVQVSCALGLGAVQCFFCVFLERARIWRQFRFLGLGLVMASLSAITFSRTGIYLIGATMFALLLTLAASRRYRLLVVSVGVITFTIVALYIVPSLNGLTNGAFSRRFSDTAVTNRDALALTDMTTFRDHPIFGVGLDGSRALHMKGISGTAMETHTEPTRMLAEHGTLGLLAFVILVLMGVRNVRRQETVPDRAVALAMLVWVFAYSVSSAMRTAAPSFVFGMSCALLMCGHETASAASSETLVGRSLGPLESVG